MHFCISKIQIVTTKSFLAVVLTLRKPDFSICFILQWSLQCKSMRPSCKTDLSYVITILLLVIVFKYKMSPIWDCTKRETTSRLQEGGLTTKKSPYDVKRNNMKRIKHRYKTNTFTLIVCNEPTILCSCTMYFSIQVFLIRLKSCNCVFR